MLSETVQVMTFCGFVGLMSDDGHLVYVRQGKFNYISHFIHRGNSMYKDEGKGQ